MIRGAIAKITNPAFVIAVVVIILLWQMVISRNVLGVADIFAGRTFQKAA